jgi:hypothetical protein
MAQLRQDPTTRDRVIIVVERARRPRSCSATGEQRPRTGMGVACGAIERGEHESGVMTWNAK